MRSKRSRSASRAVSATALGVVGEARRHLRRRRRAPSSRCRAARGSVSSSVGAGAPRRARPGARPGGGRARGRCRSRRRRRRAARRARRASGCARGRGARSGRCSSTRKRSRPKAASRRRASASARRGSPRSQLPASGAVAGAAGEADEPLVCARAASRAAARGGGGRASTASGRVSRVRLGQQPAEVAPAGRALDQQREVKARRLSVTVSSAPTIARTPSPSQAWANSIAPQTPSWSVSASAS